MKRFASATFLLFALQLGLAHAESKGGFFDLTAKAIDGKTTEMSEYRGKVVMVVNVASKCGFTSQYEGLQSLYEEYKDRGFVILGFPSNDFKSQEPGTNEEIQTFCKLNYGVNFPLFEKNPVTGASKQPVYKFLTEKSPRSMRGEVGWNFEKFLVNQKGEVVARWKSKVEPKSEEVIKKISELLPAHQTSQIK